MDEVTSRRCARCGRPRDCRWADHLPEAFCSRCIARELGRADRRWSDLRDIRVRCQEAFRAGREPDPKDLAMVVDVLGPVLARQVTVGGLRG